MSLDIETMFFASAISRGAYLVVFLITALRQPKEQCLWHWIIALIGSMIGSFIMMRVPPTENLDPTSALISYVFFGASLSLSWSGLRLFYGRRVSLASLGALTLLPAGTYGLLHLCGFSLYGCLTGIFIACMILSGLSIAEIARPSQRERLWSQYVVALAFCIYCVAFALTILTITFTDLPIRTMESSRISIIIDQITGIFIYFGYLAMAGERAGISLQRLADTDSLTGLHNRRGLEGIRRTWTRAQTSGLLIADIDHFKAINDTHGHQTGDMVLQAFAQRMTKALRAGDVGVRWGGEEFLAMLPATGSDQTTEVAERLRAAIEAEPFETSSGPIAVTVSIGIAEMGRHDPDLAAATRRADAALYVAKSTGRNKVVRFGVEATRTDAPSAAQTLVASAA